MKTTQRNFLLTLLLLIAAGMGQNAWAQVGTFTVTNSGNTFTITRSGNTDVAESVLYRTVSLSAIAGQHFTAKSGTLNGYVLIDDSYDYAQKPATVSTSTLISSTGAPVSYLNSLGYKIYATVCFYEKERDDGYQYVQILDGTSSASYDGADPNGAVNDPSNSAYKVCFEFANGSNAEGKIYFPHRGTTSSEFSNSTGTLHQQKYKSDNNWTYDGSGSVIFISNGEIIINGKGIVQVIDMMGHILVTDEANRQISTEGLVPGVYRPTINQRKECENTKNNHKMKKTLITLAIIFGMALGASAQEGGLFGKGPTRGYDNDYYANDYDRTTGLLNLPGSHGSTVDQTGEAPLGSGALLLIGFGAAYVLKKRRNH